MITTEEIDRIVQEVLRRVRELRPSTKLQLCERVVSFSSIDGKLKGIQQVEVSPRAVVTPLVRDELRAKNIQLIRQTVAQADHSGRTLIFANQSLMNLNHIVKNLPCEIQLVQKESLEEAVQETTHQLNATAALGVVVTKQPELAVCLANRTPSVRAFVGHSLECVKRSRAFDGNLMAISDPSAAARLLKSFVT